MKMIEKKENMIYVYKKGNVRFVHTTPLKKLVMKMNQLELADVIQNENGIEWYTKVIECAEELIRLMGREDRNEAIQWADYLLQDLREEVETVNGINTGLIDELEQKEKEKGLNPKEKEILDGQYKLIDDCVYNEADVYGDMHH